MEILHIFYYFNMIFAVIVCLHLESKYEMKGKLNNFLNKAENETGQKVKILNGLEFVNKDISTFSRLGEYYVKERWPIIPHKMESRERDENISQRGTNMYDD